MAGDSGSRARKLGPVSFDEDVDALRAERANLASSKAAQLAAGREAFDEEVRALWRDTLEYWNSRKSPMSARDVHYILTGKLLDEGADELVPRLFPFVQVFKRDQAGALLGESETETIHGLDVRGWFALCGPGEVRELLPTDRSRPARERPFPPLDVAGMIQEAKNKVAFGHATRLVQSEQSPGHLKSASERLIGYTTFFSASAGGTDLALSCAAEGPIHVLQADRDSWKEVATLRELVVEAVAELF